MYKVLIVEDDPMVRLINEKYVNKNKDFSVVGAVSDGKSAVKFLEENEADLVIMDIFMPQMDGLETLRMIRKMQITVDVIMVTAANDRESLEEGLHLGVIDYLVKPFTFDRFQIALENFKVQNNALSKLEVVNQKSIDFIIEGKRKKGDEIYPKGIQEKTLDAVIDVLKKNKGIKLTVDEIAQMTHLTSVTVRRYMNYLTESGKAMEEMNYETGGRPSIVYWYEG